MVSKRGKFEGALNVVQFNWPFFVFAIGFAFVWLVFVLLLQWPILVCFFGLAVVLYGVFASLIASYWVYDLSGLYRFKWVSLSETPKSILTVNAGFDETSALLKTHFPSAEFVIGDIYNEEINPEPSIRRAQKRYPKSKETIHLEMPLLPFQKHKFDTVFAILVLHEIRTSEQRVVALKEMKRVLHPKGAIVVTEHLRDFPNFMAYTFGVLHFYSRKTWLGDFEAAELTVKQEIRITPFVRSFILTNGSSS
jgi:ubiquinone/menaquinone biosynthesis C-methylase UbiE